MFTKNELQGFAVKKKNRLQIITGTLTAILFQYWLLKRDSVVTWL